MRWLPFVVLIGCSRAEKETVPVVPTIFVAPSVSVVEETDPPRTPADVDAVVALKRHGLKLQCWRPFSPPGTTVYSMTVEIEASGQISKVMMSRADNPLVGSCILKMMNTWRYPRAAAKTTHTITFSFP